MERPQDNFTRKDMLAAHYRAIGPAAVLAALLCAPRARLRAVPSPRA